MDVKEYRPLKSTSLKIIFRITGYYVKGASFGKISTVSNVFKYFCKFFEDYGRLLDKLIRTILVSRRID